jgi:hypothetical protein
LGDAGESVLGLAEGDNFKVALEICTKSRLFGVQASAWFFKEHTKV